MNNDFKFSDLKCCPFCGCEMYYEKQTVTGKIEFNSMFNGEEAPNYELYDSLEHTYSGRCYCSDCNKYLGNNLKNTIGAEAKKILLVCHRDTLRKENKQWVE